MKKVALHNLGCKVNAYETDAMREMLEKAGYEIVPFEEGADIYIINTCTVTNIADRKSRQMLHRARKMNPEAIVAAAGCYAQVQENEKHPADPCIDIVIGNNQKKDLLKILSAYEKKPVKQVTDISHTGEYEELVLSRPGERTRAYIKVQDGCNQFCSYCIIPFARGRVRSRSRESVLAEAHRLSGAGCREIVLTGIHLSSYGMDFSDHGKETYGAELLRLIREVHEIEGISRIRLSSLEPRIITEEFVQGISDLPKLCPHFHLSLQSGCDATLERMNRRYTSGEYYEKCELLRKAFRNPALTTDVIVGFPGETEEEFEESYAFVDKVNFYETHIFKYSRREGTRAAEMKDQVLEAVKAKRSSRMIELGKRKQVLYENTFIGKEAEVLMEEYTEIAGKRYQVGHTKEYMKVAVEEKENLQNCIRNVKILPNRAGTLLLASGLLP